MGKVTRQGRAWRLADAVAATLALLVLAPIIACIAVVILIDDRGSILFTQWRIGQHGRPFRIFKFRTMAPGGDPPATGRPLRQLDDHPAVTRVGRWLRRSHLDELPQLVNVVLGQMSIVGPRPLVPDEDALITRAWKERHDHRPGLTASWQIWRLAADDRRRAHRLGPGLPGGLDAVARRPVGRQHGALRRAALGALRGRRGIGKLDADVQLSPGFLERLLGDFARDPSLGMTGGLLTERHGGDWRDVTQPPTHAPPPARLYSRACFEASGGFRERLGWDTLDEVYARMCGYATRVNADVRVRHLRVQASPTGACEDAPATGPARGSCTTPPRSCCCAR